MENKEPDKHDHFKRDHNPDEFRWLEDDFFDEASMREQFKGCVLAISDLVIRYLTFNNKNNE